MEQKIFDGEGAVLGRMGSVVAKELLKGYAVTIINAEKVIISGDKKHVIDKIRAKRRMGGGGSLKGPKYLRQEDRLLKRMIRGMLPRDRTKGQEAIRRLKCYIGTPKEIAEKATTFDHQKPFAFTTIQAVVGGLR